MNFPTKLKTYLSLYSRNEGEECFNPICFSAIDGFADFGTKGCIQTRVQWWIFVFTKRDKEWLGNLLANDLNRKRIIKNNGSNSFRLKPIHIQKY